MKRKNQKIILRMENLSVNFPMEESEVLAVRDVTLAVDEGSCLGLVGESGCGKSVTAFSIMRLVQPPGKIRGGKILYKNRDLLALPEEEMRKIRSSEIAMIFQEPMTSLNPVLKIGFQILEPLMIHLGMDRKTALDASEDLLRQVGIPDPGKRIHSYPHELSGGMRQRVMIAMALAASPSLLIADEPTTALDVTIQAQILELLLDQQKKRDMSLVLITHDLGIVANVADFIAIMYAGEIFETGSVRRIFSSPLHPYTVGLFNAIPRIGDRKKKLNPIPGMVPTITEKPSSCIFYPRCALRAEECMQGPVALTEKKPGQWVRCIRV